MQSPGIRDLAFGKLHKRHRLGIGHEVTAVGLPPTGVGQPPTAGGELHAANRRVLFYQQEVFFLFSLRTAPQAPPSRSAVNRLPLAVGRQPPVVDCESPAADGQFCIHEAPTAGEGSCVLTLPVAKFKGMHLMGDVKEP